MITRNHLFGVVTFLISITLLEVGYISIRYLSKIRIRNEVIHSLGKTAVDDHFGFKYKPNLKNYIFDLGKGNISTDNFGFRNVGKDYKNAKIAVVGDSFMSPQYLLDEQSAAFKLSKELGVEVVNIAVSGWSLYQYLKTIDFIHKNAPNVDDIFIVVYTNDFLSYRELPDVKWAKKHFKAPKEIKFNDVVTEYSLFLSLYNLFKEEKKPKTRKHKCEKIIGKVLHTSLGTISMTQRKFHQKDLEATWKLMKTIHNKNNEINKELNKQTSLKFVLLPSQFHTHYREVNESCPNLGSEYKNKQDEAFQKTINTLEKKGIEVFDFSPTLFAHWIDKNEMAYLPDNGHHNELGQELLSLFLIDLMKK